MREQFIRDFAALWPGAVALTERQAREAWLAEVATLIRLWRPAFRRAGLATYRQAAELETGAVPAGLLAAGTTPALSGGAVLGSMLETAFKPITRALRGRAQLDTDSRRRRLARVDPDALARAAEGAARLALNAGRDAVVQTVQEDRLALGWMRVTDGDPCHFCLTLASRGPAYKSRTTAGFEAHDSCACQAVPVFTRNPILPESTVRAKEVYDAAQKWARETGNQSSGTSNDLLNNVRRYMAQLSE